jgi:hypothetical protein
MTKQDRRNAGILVLLLAVLGLTVFLGYRMTRPPATAAVQTPEQQKVAVNTLAPGDAKIRVDLVEKETGEENIGKRNLFQYRQAPPPPPPSVPQRGTGASPFGPGNSGLPPGGLPPQPPRPTGPPQPPPPPPITLKYQGFVAKSTPSGGFTAFLADDSRHYNVTVGEILMGKYRIAGITDKSVDVEDLDNNRRQSLPLLK